MFVKAAERFLEDNFCVITIAELLIYSYGYGKDLRFLIPKVDTFS